MNIKRIGLIGGNNSIDVVNDLTTGGTNKALSAEQGKVLNSTKQNTLTGSEFKTVNGSSIWGSGNIVITGGEGASVEIVNDLTTGGADKALSAEMGKELYRIATDTTIIHALSVIYNSIPLVDIGDDGDYALFLFTNSNQRLYKKTNGAWTIFTDYKKVIVITGNRTFYRESNNQAEAFTEITTPIIDFELSLTGEPTSSTEAFEGKHYIWYNESVPRTYAYTYTSGIWRQIHTNTAMDNPIFKNGNDFYKYTYHDSSSSNGDQLTKIIDNGLYDELSSKVEELESEIIIEELAVMSSGDMPSTGASERAFYLSVNPLTTYKLRFKAQYEGRLTLYASTDGSDNIGTILDAQQVDFKSEYETTITTPANCNVIRTRTYVVTTIDYISLYTSSTLKEVIGDIRERVEAIEEKQKVQPNDWQGKVISFYGDSVTALNGGDFNYPYDESSFGHRWSLRVANYLQASSVKNRGIGGQRFNWHNNGGSVSWVNESTGELVGRNDSYNYDNYVGNVTIPSNCTPIRGALSSWLRITSMYPESIKDTIDVVLVMSHNDMGFDATTEVQFVEGDNTDAEWVDSSYYQTYGGDYNITTVKGGIASTIMKLQAWMPNAVIVLMTPISGRGEEGELNLELTSRMTEITNAVKDVHNLMSIPCIDVYGTCGINGLNRTRYITDTIHPYSEDGSKMIARAVIGGMKGIIPNMLVV